MQAKDRIILALDVDETAEATSLVQQLAAHVGTFKVGMQLFNSVGPDIVRRIQDLGGRVFVDLKLHDIPNSVAGAARAIARLGCFMYTVHAAGGSSMIQAAASAARDWQHESGQPTGEPSATHQAPIMLAVTVLTSIDQHQLEQGLLIKGMPIREVAVRMAKMAQIAGAGGVICSPHEIAAVRDTCGPDFVIVTPGIRPVWYGSNDQKRITTPADAVRLGADYIVIGRPITRAPHPASAAIRIAEEMEDAAY
ncbi:MAG: orotidine-5'-phosphate decarboxylase [Firmicutes bacterium]|nr:orotidine-5'-phosphate decarboxylase [Bacillota bacterium]